MKSYTINDKEVNIPENWSEVTFIQVVRMALVPDNEREVVSIFTGIPEDELSTSKDIEVFEKILIDISFLSNELSNYPLSNTVTLKGKQLIIPKDLLYHSVGQYEDLKAIIKQMNNEGKELSELEVMQLYPDMLAIYLQPQLDGDYDYFKAQELVNDIYLLPCQQVIGAGAFFLMTYNVSKSGTLKDVMKEATRRKKGRQVFLTYLKRMARQLLFTPSQSSTTRKEIVS